MGLLFVANPNGLGRQKFRADAERGGTGRDKIPDSELVDTAGGNHRNLSEGHLQCTDVTVSAVDRAREDLHKVGAGSPCRDHFGGVADLNYSVQFSTSEDGRQTATVRRIDGARAAGFDEEGEEIVNDAPVSVGREALVTTAGDYRFFFGWRSDTFFFVANGLFNNMQFTEDDFFIDKDVCSILFELPNSAFGSKEVGLCARTVEKTGEGWIQADRGGRPLQPVFLAGDSREAYLSGQPADDDRFIKVFAHELEHSGGYAPGDAIAIARKLLPGHSFP